uniref:Uncharacterized protein n=1 Tax=viral metagenome TaxID=1070528 RepID=A0A6C0EGJ4_9ZZZZ
MVKIGVLNVQRCKRKLNLVLYSDDSVGMLNKLLMNI